MLTFPLCAQITNFWGNKKRHKENPEEVNGDYDIVVPFCNVKLCLARGFVTILLKARHEELKEIKIDECSPLIHAMYGTLQMGSKRKII